MNVILPGPNSKLIEKVKKNTEFKKNPKILRFIQNNNLAQKYLKESLELFKSRVMAIEGSLFNQAHLSASCYGNPALIWENSGI